MLIRHTQANDVMLVVTSTKRIVRMRCFDVLAVDTQRMLTSMHLETFSIDSSSRNIQTLGKKLNP